MTEAEWLACGDPMAMLESLKGKASGRKFRLLACGCCRVHPDYRTNDDLPRAIANMEADADSPEEPANSGSVSPPYRNEYDPLVRSVRFIDRYHAAEFTLNQICYWQADIYRTIQRDIVAVCRDIFGNPFRPVLFSADWRTDTALSLARTMYESRDFSPMPILADALQDAGCDDEQILSHCRSDGPHVRGCWVVDLLTGRK